MVALNVSVLARLRSLTELSSRVVDSLSSTDVALPSLRTKSARVAAPVDSPVKPMAPLASADERRHAETVVQQVLAELPRAMAIAVIDATSAMPIASAGAPSHAGPASMAVQMARIARRAAAMVAAVADPSEISEEFIFSSSEQLHLLRPAADGRWLVYLAIDALDTNLAIARSLLEGAATTLSTPPSTPTT